jgi:predicted AlkP superfamily phosphohydrolase/phosphomutase
MENPPGKALVIGLDCATTQYVFGAPRGALPNLDRLRAQGHWGLLESCVPAITCPAWMCMATSRDPGQLGIYGFRNRASYAYDSLTIPDSGSITAPTVWDIASEHGRRSLVVGLPLTYPPKPLNGWLVSGCLTPGTHVEYTYPHDVRDIVEEEVRDYEFDVSGFRTDDKDGLLDRIYRVARRQFSVFERLLRTKPWDLAWCVDMGVDRIQHAFWSYAASDHRLYEPGNPYEDAILRYYQYIDGCIGRLRALVPQNTAIFVVSDHGARTLRGALCVNDWLIREGLLVLKQGAPATPTALRHEMIDWSRTQVWAEGGYYSRVMVNVAGREPEGIVPPEQYGPLLERLTARLEGLRDDRGAPMGNRAFRPADIYRTVNGCAPDLLVYFGDLGWRAAGTVGHASIYAQENDTGPDDANHAQHGVFILADPRSAARGELEGVSIYDIAPTLLKRMGLPVPPEMIGRPIPLESRRGAGCLTA